MFSKEDKMLILKTFVAACMIAGLFYVARMVLEKVASI